MAVTTTTIKQRVFPIAKNIPLITLRIIFIYNEKEQLANKANCLISGKIEGFH
ncbi:hypothetical protein [Bacillus cereus]|uniref:hypothetical protein n=1 Tax=Bacillus cereus TaxID=1396 RepID=UPI0001A0A49E|nr:hypothetical protein bcere0022_24570 [Bacillus cereus Rock3-44]